MEAKLAKSLVTLRDQINARWPKRSKESDGWIGDSAHSARTSDHNPDSSGIVHAMDITHDPRSGCDSYVLAEVLRAGRDKRVKYLISNRKICAPDISPWNWRPYNGANPHDHHVHISVKNGLLADDGSSWDLSRVKMPDAQLAAPAPMKVLRHGNYGEEVRNLQKKLASKGIVIEADSQFGIATKLAVQRIQKAAGLVPDGVVGPMTWAVLNK